MIRSFLDKGTADIYHGKTSGQARKTVPRNLMPVAIRKLEMLDAAFLLDDLKIPPRNRLESLSGNLKGYYSIRINNQYRIIFKWSQVGPENVKITDYH
jgi:toxin HigB-1